VRSISTFWIPRHSNQICRWTKGTHYKRNKSDANRPQRSCRPRVGRNCLPEQLTGYIVAAFTTQQNGIDTINVPSRTPLIIELPPKCVERGRWRKLPGYAITKLFPLLDRRRTPYANLWSRLLINSFTRWTLGEETRCPLSINIMPTDNRIFLTGSRSNLPFETSFSTVHWGKILTPTPARTHSFRPSKLLILQPTE